jgi:hypothetical protein
MPKNLKGFSKRIIGANVHLMKSSLKSMRDFGSINTKSRFFTTYPQAVLICMQPAYSSANLFTITDLISNKHK